MTNTHTTNQAQEYADSIAETLRAWDLISDAWTEAVGHDDEARYAAVWLRWQVRHGNATQARYAPLALSEVDDLGGFEFIEEQGGPGMAWGYGTLDAYAITHQRPGQKDDVRGAEFVVSLGGPNCYVKNDGADSSTITVYWGSDTGTSHASCQAVDAAAEAIMDAAAYGY